ncbi:low-density lipoprotein receptor-related protein-like [Amphiura filiformis]|uniref:low-density lipoprotein receptor-related protein-like n=1 Tax=Amphiura filiformis TaxID=82378 RepID=UPI003B224F44
MKACNVLMMFGVMKMLGIGFSDYATKGFPPVPCDQISSRHSKFECGDGTCLMESRYSRQCDSIIDCANAQDEDPTRCRLSHHRYCREIGIKHNNKFFQCDDGMCIEKQWMNDNEWDCHDKSDENQ